MDINRNVAYVGDLIVSVQGKCVFASNSIPNHDFNDGDQSFVTDVVGNEAHFEVPMNPEVNQYVTELSLQWDNAIFLNGVKLDMLAAACYGVCNKPLAKRRSAVVPMGNPGDTIPCF